VRVDLDEQIFLRQRRGGVSRYFAELWLEANRLPDVMIRATWKWHSNDHARQVGLGQWVPSAFTRSARLSRALNRGGATAAAGDVSHHTYYDLSHLKRSHARLKAITIYDMIPELFPELFSGPSPHVGKEECARAADLIFCISHATRDDLLRLYDLDASKVVVTPLGVANEFSSTARAPAGLPPQYFLYVGNRASYKDFDVLVAALRGTDSPLRQFPLVCVGGGAFTGGERALLHRAGMEGRVSQMKVTERELPGVYASASCFIFPSRYEGFGLPTLEAMKSGCPTLLARSSSHVEVGGDAAFYFEPQDSADLREQLIRIVGDDAERASHVRSGVARADAFSWRSTALQTVLAYQKALEVAR